VIVWAIRPYSWEKGGCFRGIYGLRLPESKNKPNKEPEEAVFSKLHGITTCTTVLFLVIAVIT
jgi:hypothetical protein